MFMDISFIDAVPYKTDKGQRGPPGAVLRLVTDQLVTAAFRGTRSKSADQVALAYRQSDVFTSSCPTE